MPDLTELDRLIEEGLTLYGQGDLDAALLVWEQALAVDPDNAQANSYVDYVRMNYEMLTTDAGNDESAPFGIADEEPEYQIEILPGELKPTPGAPMYMDPQDEGWFMEAEPERAGMQPQGRPSEETIDKMIDLEPQPLMLELEADEPPLPEPPGVNFEDATREYEPRMVRLLRPPTAEPVSKSKGSDNAAINDLFSQETMTAEFQPEGTPGFGSPDDVKSFATQVTDVKKRDLGFIKPAEPPPLAEESVTPDPDELPAPPVTRARRMSSQAPPELVMTLRTPTESEPTPVPPPPASSEIALSYEDPQDDLSDDLISSLPKPKASHTRDLPSDIVPPAAAPTSAASSARISLESFDLGEPELPPEISLKFNASMPIPTVPTTPTRDFSEKPTEEIRQRPPAAEPDPLVSAPTRELGLRPQRALTEDEPTVSKPPLDPRMIGVGAEGTRSDIVLPFDPIDARTQQILEEVDEGVAENEQKDDQTRRRITVLLERATEWSKGPDLDRAVAAVDLALSEDPNSALAQKLIHRNRDAIMGVFQNFLGDLNRQPILARPLHELAAAPISPRAAFLLSRVDGTLSLDEVLDVSGMPRLEAYRYLCQLFLRGILR